MTTVRPVLVTAMVVILLSGILSGLAFGADAPKAAECKIGIVDYDKVNGQYSEVKDGRTELDAYAASLSEILKLRQKYSLLQASELDELDKLQGTAKPADKDTARIQELQKKGDDLAAELEILRNKKDATDAEKARLKELTDLSTKSSADVEARRAQYATQFETKQKDMLDKLYEKTNAAIADLAQQKGLWMVVDKSTTLWGGVDITDDLITKLNKK